MWQDKNFAHVFIGENRNGESVSVIAVSKETGEVQHPDFSPLPSWMTGEPPTDDDVALENASEIDLI